MYGVFRYKTLLPVFFSKLASEKLIFSALTGKQGQKCGTVALTILLRCGNDKNNNDVHIQQFYLFFDAIIFSSGVAPGHQNKFNYIHKSIMTYIYNNFTRKTLHGLTEEVLRKKTSIALQDILWTRWRRMRLRVRASNSCVMVLGKGQSVP